MTSAAELKENLVKQAAIEKEAADMTIAFGAGIDDFLQNYNFDKEAFAKAAGLDDSSKLTEATLAWTHDRMNQTPGNDAAQ